MLISGKNILYHIQGQFERKILKRLYPDSEHLQRIKIKNMKCGDQLFSNNS